MRNQKQSIINYNEEKTTLPICANCDTIVVHIVQSVLYFNIFLKGLGKVKALYSEVRSLKE